MSFGYRARSVYTMSTDKFTGIDLSAKNKNLLTGGAAMAENMFVNATGGAEKRRGYKILYKTEGVINGVYEYFYKGDENICTYVLHEGDNLYILSETEDGFEKGTCLYEGVGDVKSRGFSFGNGLFIMAEGYYKLAYNELFDTMIVGRVKDTAMKDLAQVIVSGRSRNAVDGTVCDVISAESKSHVIKFKSDVYCFDERTTGRDRLYISDKDCLNSVRVTELKMGDTVIDCYHYSVASDESGTYVELYRKNTNVSDYYECEPQVTICYTDFVYSPKNIVSRLAIGLDNLDDANIIADHSEREQYSGVYTEDLNLASSKRIINFFVNLSDFSSAETIRFYLESDTKKSGEVLQIKIGGVLLHAYERQYDGYTKETVVYLNSNRYVDINKSFIKSIGGSGDIAVEIEYINYDEESEIDACGIYGFYDGANDMKVFLSGNAKNPARDYESGVYDASYFPALKYTAVGKDHSAILGYGRHNSYQLVFKDNSGEAEIYFRSCIESDSAGGFKIIKGASSEAAASENAVLNVNSKLFFMAEDGLYTVESTSVEGQSKNVLRSEAINELLLAEDVSALRLAKADNKLLILGEERIYVLDIAKDYSWYIYRLPHKAEDVGKLGREVVLYKNAIAAVKEEGDESPYSDTCLDGSEAAVSAYWRTNAVNFMPYKRRDVLSAYCVLDDIFTRSGAEILYTADDYEERAAKQANRDLFTFADIDFARFSFRCVRMGRSIKTHLRSKRVEKFSLTVRNDKAENLKINEIGFLYS